MFYVYVLQSEVNSDIYLGFTSDLKARLKQHNEGGNKSTKRSIPWKLIYYEAYSRKYLAAEREKQLKRHAKSYAMLKKRIGL